MIQRLTYYVEMLYVVLDPRVDEIWAAYKPGATVKEIGQAVGADIGINFNYADIVAGMPIGRLIVDGVTVIPDSSKTQPRDELYMLPDRTVHIGKAPSDAIWAVQGSPRLLKDGKNVVHETIQRDQTSEDIWQRRAIRTAAGITTDGRLVLVRTLGAVYLSELTEIMIALGCIDALNGDGGGSSYLWPEDSGWGRKVGSAIVVKKGEKPMGGVIQDFIPVGRGNRPGVAMTPKYITIHDTANTSSGANALMHAKYLKGDMAANLPVSWHFTVDDQHVVQHLPLNEHGWHAGDGNGPGNRSSIAIEICENEDGNRAKAEENAAKLTASLLKQLNLPIDAVIQHNKWSGKNCPRVIRGRSGGWTEFLAKVKRYLEVDVSMGGRFKDVPAGHWAEASIVKAAKAGIITGVADGEFGLGQPVTREQLVVILDRLGLLEKGGK